MRTSPLARIGSIKLRIGLIIVAAVTATAVLISVGGHLGVPALPVAALAVLASLALVQLLAHGLTAPLREMAGVARAMAAGAHDERVTRETELRRDEVGQLALAFNRMATELAGTDRFRRDLLAAVSHELRTPLSALQATLENLVDGVEEPDPATLAVMSAQVARLARLTTALLGLSRLEAGVVPLDRRPVVVADLLGRVRDEAALDGDGARVQVAGVPADLTVEADEDRLHQVLANLVENALRHGPPGTPVRLGAEVREGWVEMAVTDAGPGIAPVDEGRALQRYGRLVDQAGGGSGLGLAIARWITELHGGDLRLASTPEGFRAAVVLPAAAPPVAPDTVRDTRDGALITHDGGADR